jgi:hypothetical protein
MLANVSGHARNCLSEASFSGIANEPYIYPKEPSESEQMMPAFNKYV